MGEAIGAEAAAEHVAPRFTRVMRAATSRLGVFTDPPIVCAAMAVVVLVSVILYNTGVIDRTNLPVVYAVIALPVVIAVGINASLRAARRMVVNWLAGLPFPLENVNALLNGVGHHLVVRFDVDTPPTRQAISDMLDAINVDCFALDFHEEEPEVALVIGVPDSKINPAAASHQRFMRVQRMVDECLVPLSSEHTIAWVRVT